MRVLAIGDVFGAPGRKAVTRWLPGLIDETGAGFTIVNVENLHDGSGVDAAGIRDVLDAGADMLTSGNHVWSHRTSENLLDSQANLLRPANYPAPCPGQGVAIGVAREGVRVAVINIIGRVFMQPVDDPFRIADEILDELEGEADVIMVDVHAEATSEKLALATHLDGRVTGVFGTHTHVQTADARVLPGGTGFITDLGMTGPYDSIIGKRKERIVERFRTARPVRAETASGGVGLRGALFEIDLDSYRCREVTRIALGEGGR